MFVATRDELEEQVRSVLIEPDVADLVSDEDALVAQPGRLRREFAAEVGVLEAGDPACRGVEQDPMALFGGLNAQCDGEAGFACTGRAEEEPVLRFCHECARAWVRARVPVRGWRVIEVQVLQDFVAREPGRFDPPRRGFAFGALAGEGRGEVFLMRPDGVARRALARAR